MIFFLFFALMALAIAFFIVYGVKEHDGEIIAAGIFCSLFGLGILFGFYSLIVTTVTGTPTALPTKSYSIQHFAGSDAYAVVTYDEPGVFYSTNVTVNLGQKNGVPQTLTADMTDVKIITTTGKAHVDVIKPISHHPLLWPWKSAYEYTVQYNVYVPKGAVTFNGLDQSHK